MSTSFRSILFALSLTWTLVQCISASNSSYLPPYIAGSSHYGSYPWGASKAQVTWQDAPKTGVTRSYNFTVARGTVSPDGYPKPALLVNNHFPGPMIEANWGDIISVTVHNAITGPEEGTSMHWHGLYQHFTPWSDGAPGVHLCPIAPGDSYTYTFQADQYGTTWWHSHFDAQYTDGLFGPMVIYGPKNVDYDYDAGVVMVGTYYHNDYHYYVELTSGIPFQLPYGDNNLINGKNAIMSNCSTLACTDYDKMETFQFQPGKSHRLRLINIGGDGIQRFSVDGHKMTVIANDLTPVVPYETEIVSLGVGQRTDIIVTAGQKPGSSWWMRSDFTAAPCGISYQPHALSAVYYAGGNGTTLKPPKSTANPAQNSTEVMFCKNDNLNNTQPLFTSAPPDAPATTKEIEVTLGVNASGNSLFYMNGVSFRGDYNHPVLPLANEGNISYPDSPEWNVYDFGSNSSVRLILINNSTLAHPIHLHGHQFWVLAEGVGKWDGRVQSCGTPQRRDIQIVQGATPAGETGYLVLEWMQNNPGVWPLHCHIAWHVSTGLYINVMERPKDIAKIVIPDSISQLCNAWDNYTSDNVVDQIDSGLKALV